MGNLKLGDLERKFGILHTTSLTFSADWLVLQESPDLSAWMGGGVALKVFLWDIGSWLSALLFDDRGAAP